MFNVLTFRRLFEAAADDVRKKKTPYNKAWVQFKEGLASGQISTKDLSLKKFFTIFVKDGHQLVESFDPKQVNQTDMLLLEASGAVDTSAFTAISGQIIYTVVMERWNNPELIWNQLMDNEQTSFNGEKIAGIGGIGDQFQTIGEGEEYPMLGFSEEYIDTPTTAKRGGIVAVTQEALFFDRTNQVLSRAASVSDAFAMNKEKRCLDTALGITTSYRRNGAAAIATYGDTPFDNLAASNTLVDWTDIENAELLFDAMVDPTTGEPIAVTPDTIIVPTALKNTAKRILNATMIRQGAVSASEAITYSNSPITPGDYNIVTGQYVKNRTSSASTWFIGQPKRAFKYMVNHDISSVPLPPNSYLEWSRDIVAGYKVSERGSPAVIEPRYMVKCT